jgi:thiamine biosynthesis lipoprotein
MTAVRVWAFMPLLLAALSTWGCDASRNSGPFRAARILMGTYVEITLTGDEDTARKTAHRVFQELKRVERVTSFHERSDLTQLNRKADNGAVPVSEELFDLIKEAVRYAKQTDGAFDPTVGALSSLWRFSAGEPVLPTAQQVKKALETVGWRSLELNEESHKVKIEKQGMTVDLGAIAKGYALDRAGEIVRGSGAPGGLVNAGGDVLVVGGKAPGIPWKIGVQDPRDPQGLIAVAELTDCAVVTSGDYERFFERDGTRYHHILDPRTGYPARGVRSVTIVSPSATEADALATAVFVMGAEKGLDLINARQGVEGFIIDANGKVRMSTGGAPLFTMKP